MLDGDKRTLRTRLRHLRKSLAEDEAAFGERSRLAQTALLASRLWRDSGPVVLYHAVRDEMGTDRLIAAAHEQGKRLYLPRCQENSTGRMDLLRCPPGGPLLLSIRGIPEPPPHAEALTAGDLAQALIVVPGLAFDRQGRRLGYGGGYYDRLLAEKRGVAVGLAFAAQLVDALRADPWDVPVDALVTEEGWLWF